jgi:hypothetical protein
MLMIRCPTCESILDEMGFAKVQCPHCGTVIDTRPPQPQPGGAGYPAPIQNQQPGQPPYPYPQQSGPYPQQGPYYQPQGPYPQQPAGYPQQSTPYQQPPGGSPPQGPLGMIPPHPGTGGYGPMAPYPYGMPPYQPPRPKLDAFQTLSEAVQLYRDHFYSFFEFWAIPGILSMMFLMMIVLSPLEEGGDDNGGIILMILLFGIALLIVQILFSGGVIAMTKEVMDSGSTSSSAGYAILSKRGGAIVVSSIAVSLIVGLGTVCFIIPGILFCYWYFFTVTIVTLEGLSTGDALSKSKDFSKGQGAIVFILVLLLSIFGIRILGEVLIQLLFYTVPGGEIIAYVISGLLSWAISPLIYVATAYYYLKAQSTPVPGGSPGSFNPWPGGGYPQQEGENTDGLPGPSINDGSDPVDSDEGESNASDFEDDSPDDSDYEDDADDDSEYEDEDYEDSGNERPWKRITVDGKEVDDEIPTVEPEWVPEDDEEIY